MREERALARRAGPARAGGAGPFAEAESRLREAVEEVTRLDAELEALSEALAHFARRWERAVGGAFAELSAAERVVGRLQALEEGLAGLASGASPPPAGPLSPGLSPGSRRGRGGGRRPARRQRGGADDRADGEANGADGAPAGELAPEILPTELALKRLFRRLARVLHPDLARDEPERRRLGELMARVNAAYEDGDLTALEVMAEKVGAGEPPGELSPEERRAHLERRAANLARIAASLARERDRLARSDTQRLREEALRREAEGRDYLADSRVEILDEAEAAYADARARLARLDRVARDVSRARSTAMKQLERRGPTGARRAFDPLQETELVRLGAARLDRRRATPQARALARTLEARAAEAPWEVALTLLAFFAEDAGGRPPDALAGADGWALRWDRLRAAWPGAPDLPRALARLPDWLAVGARAQGDALVAGVQLADAALLAGVRVALGREEVARLARTVLAALGPDGACRACRARGPGVHLMRTRGLDELHGVVCAACGAVLRSYWRYGAADGLEALAPHALRLGLVAEATLQLAGTTIGFQMLPGERDALTADGLRRRFAELYLSAHGVELPASAVAIAAGGEKLPGSARLRAGDRLRLALARGAGPGEDELLELLRARIERRFRP